MASSRRSDLSSPFDEMLEENRRQLEELYGGPSTPAPGTPAAPAPSAAPPAAPGVRRLALDASSSEAVRFLDDRYGDRWRYEISDRQRIGDEVVVLCKLVLEDHGITKSQFGRARIGDSRGAAGIRGSAGGIAFAMGAETPRAASADPVEEAFRRAEDAALAKCAGLI